MFFFKVINNNSSLYSVEKNVQELEQIYTYFFKKKSRLYMLEQEVHETGQILSNALQNLERRNHFFFWKK